MLVILPLACFIALLFTFLRQRSFVDPRFAFLWAAVVWGVITAVLTEVLSLVNLVTAPGLALGWGAITLGLVVFARAQTGPRYQIVRPRLGRVEVLALGAPILIVLVITALLALISWPNNPAAMVYHLSRVAHWTQNGSVAFYPTHILRQLFFQPWAEYAMLHLTLLGGDERLAQLVQWFSMLGSLVGVSLIARQLGAAQRGQLLSAMFCATIPMGILQASSSQNSYATAFWTVCLACALLAMHAGDTRRAPVLAAGASLGLALLTKGTAYVIAAPLLGLHLLTRTGWRSGSILRQGTIVGLLALALVAPQYYRNYALFGSVLGPVREDQAGRLDATFGLTNEAITPGIIASNLVRSIALHLGTPVPTVNQALTDWIREWHARFGLDVDDPRTTRSESEPPFDLPSMEPHEGQVGNLLHMLLVAGATVALAACCRWQRSGLLWRYALAVWLGFVLFSLVFKWQPGNSRLQLPLFVLWSPVLGVVLERNARVMAIAALAVTVGSWPFLVANRSHPLIGEQSVLRSGRARQYFFNHPSIAPGYEGAARFIRSKGCSDVGLLFTSEWEYPIWGLLPNVRAGAGRIEHVGVTNRSARLAGGSSFTPCAVVVVRGPDRDTLSLGSRSYSRAWSTTQQTRERSSRKIEVFTLDA